jgi:bifunctional NMN adenylyltransferase/nudix hydrolase
MSKMKALVIGRFQPVHLGHVGLLQDADALGLEKILLGIGIEGKCRTERNPFTYEEIRAMWLPELAKLSTPAEIYRIPDTNDPLNYAYHVERITGCSESDTIIVSGNPSTLDSFTRYGRSYRTFSPSGEDNPHDGLIHGTLIREWLWSGGPWRAFVPESAAKVIDGISRADGLVLSRKPAMRPRCSFIETLKLAYSFVTGGAYAKAA